MERIGTHADIPENPARLAPIVAGKDDGVSVGSVPAVVVTADVARDAAGMSRSLRVVISVPCR
jgi:hypothetical protein